MSISNQNIELFKPLFRGRDDLYAVRWERDGKSGYMPAYDVDWSNYEKHKLQGGTFSNYKDKKLQPYNDSAIKIHLEGKATHGIYPLLEDNTSFFIAVVSICILPFASIISDFVALILFIGIIPMVVLNIIQIYLTQVASYRSTNKQFII